MQSQPDVTERLTPQGAERAAHLLRQGQIVALPTETVYGLACDARNPEAVARVYAAKGRPAHNPLIVHLADPEDVARYATPPKALADLWPGPLTLVLPLRPDAGLAPSVTAGGASVAIRVPAHPVMRAVLQAFDGPLAAPSANPSGRISPTTADHVLDGLSGRIAAVIDGGPCAAGIESTIVDMRDTPRLLRQGAIPIEVIEAHLGHPLAEACDGPIVAPGQLTSHYAPKGSLRLNVTTPDPNEAMIGFGPIAGELTLSASGDLAEAAATLYKTLRALDDRPRIAVAPIPETGLGRAINDRLRRAAAPRDMPSSE